MAELVIFIPVITGLLACFIKPQHGRMLLPFTGVLHFIVSALCFSGRLHPIFKDNIRLAPEGLIVLCVTSFLFLVISFYSTAYLKAENFKNEKLFTASFLFFLASMSSVSITNHLILFWISVEATTLTSAPLIYMHKTNTALEGTWKYVIICSVGIALALLGTFLIAAARDFSGLDIPLTFSELQKHATAIPALWLKLGFVVMLVGYGTKMGLAPMHTWLPDAHSQAPSPGSALLSGALLNTAFLGIFKTNKILQGAGLGEFASTILIVLGLLSVIVAAIFILKQKDYKRMLAYSSVENMGIIAFGTGIGGIAAYGAMLHLIHHALIKSSLFLSSGNILLSYKTKMIDKIGNLNKLMPKTSFIFIAGFVAIAGFPPFGLFFSEFFIITGAYKQGKYYAAAALLIALIIVMAGLAKHVLKICFDNTSIDDIDVHDSGLLIYPQYILLITSLTLCLFQFEKLYNLLSMAVAGVGGNL